MQATVEASRLHVQRSFPTSEGGTQASFYHSCFLQVISAIYYSSPSMFRKLLKHLRLRSVALPSFRPVAVSAVLASLSACSFLQTKETALTVCRTCTKKTKQNKTKNKKKPKKKKKKEGKKGGEKSTLDISRKNYLNIQGRNEVAWFSGAGIISCVKVFALQDGMTDQ